jgi:hypothetical protein
MFPVSGVSPPSASVTNLARALWAVHRVRWTVLDAWRRWPPGRYPTTTRSQDYFVDAAPTTNTKALVKRILDVVVEHGLFRLSRELAAVG